MKLLVTGANGFIGKRIVSMFPEAHPITSDVLDADAIGKEIRELSDGQAYTVINCAAISDVDKCESDKKKAWNVNVVGVENILRNIHPEFGKFFQLSSCHVFSGKNYFPYSEAHSPDPVNYYGYTKYASEAYLSTYPNVKTLSVRLGKVYSTSTMTSILKCSTSVPSFIKRNFIYVNDVARILRLFAYFDGVESFPSFPVFKKLYRVVHVGHPDQNLQYDLFYNLVRNNLGVEKKVESRKQEIPGYNPRPFRCALNVNRMKKLIGNDYTFRSL